MGDDQSVQNAQSVQSVRTLSCFRLHCTGILPLLHDAEDIHHHHDMGDNMGDMVDNTADNTGDNMGDNMGDTGDTDDTSDTVDSLVDSSGASSRDHIVPGRLQFLQRSCKACCRILPF